MAVSKVLSIRLSLPTLAMCYKILQELGVPVYNLSMSRCVRTVLDAVVQAHITDESFPAMSDQQAVEFLQELSVREAGATVKDRPKKFDVSAAVPNGDTHSELVRSLPTDIYDMDEGPETEEQRNTWRRMAAPVEMEVKAELDEERFQNVIPSAARVLEESEEAPTTVQPEDNPIPPWRNAKKVPSADLLEARKGSRIIQKFFTNEDQVGLMAARVVLAKLGSDMLGTNASETVIDSVYTRFKRWVDKDSARTCPPSIKFD